MRWISLITLLIVSMACGVAGALTWESELEHSSSGGYLKADDIHGRVHLGLTDVTAYKVIDSGVWTVVNHGTSLSANRSSTSTT